MSRLLRTAILLSGLAANACVDLTGLDQLGKDLEGITACWTAHFPGECGTGSGNGRNKYPPPANPSPTTLTLSVPRVVVGEPTWDPVLLWGSRCEVTVEWAVSGPSIVLFEPGSTVTWIQINDAGRSDPMRAPWDPAAFFGTTQLAAGSSGSITRTWIGGNDGNHPDSAPFWDDTILIRYRTVLTGEIKVTAFSVECARPAP